MKDFELALGQYILYRNLGKKKSKPLKRELNKR